MAVVLGGCGVAGGPRRSRSGVGGDGLHRWDADGNALDAVGTRTARWWATRRSRPGTSGQAFAFDGSGDHVSVADGGHRRLLPGDGVVHGRCVGVDERDGIPADPLDVRVRGLLLGSAVGVDVHARDRAADRRPRTCATPTSAARRRSKGRVSPGGRSSTTARCTTSRVTRDVEGSRLVLFVDGVAVADEPLGPGASGAISNLDPDDDPFTIGGQILGGTSSLSTAACRARR